MTAAAPGGQQRSPYELVLGDRVSELHPRLKAYFSAIPAGHHGVGSGVFRTAGTPRRWLWPVLAVLGRQGVLFPMWHRDLPFTVVNRPGVDSRGTPFVAAVRTFHTGSGDRRMRDRITTVDGALVDYLGSRSRYRATLSVDIRAGELFMESASVAVRLGTGWIPIPAWIRPRVTLTERFDELSGLQQVAVTTAVPLIGRVYEYAGAFDYALQRDGEDQ